jgi:glycerate kinase
VLEKHLAHFAAVVARDLGIDMRGVEAGGAAGGIAAGLSAVLGARIAAGTDWVLDAIGYDAHLDGASVVITGEGRLDRQTLRNKGPYGAAMRAKGRGVPVVALVGSVDDTPAMDFSVFDTVVALVSGAVTVDEAGRNAAVLLERAAERAARRLPTCR